MPGRDDYAMFCYGVVFDNEELAINFITAYPDLPLEEQGIGNIDDDHVVVYIRGAESAVGSRTGSMIKYFDIICPPRDLQLSFNGNIYIFSWILVIWGPTYR